MRKIVRRLKENFPISLVATASAAFVAITTKMETVEAVIVCTLVFVLSLLFQRKRRG